MNKFIQIRMIPAAFLGVLLCAVGLLWPESEYRRPLTVAVNIWPGSERLVMACDASNTKDQRINIVEMSWSTAVMGAFRKHVVDAAVVTLDELIRLEADGAKPRAVLILGVSKGSDAIMGHTGQMSMQSLRGKHIGVELRSSSEYLLRHALMANGMSFQDVEVVPLNLAETEAAYKEKGIDAVVSSDPWCTRLQDKGATVLFDSSQMDLELSRVLVVREDVLQAYPRELHSLVSACLKIKSQAGWTEIENGQDATLRRAGFTLEQWKKSLKKIHLPDAAENRRLFVQKAGGLEECLKKMSVEMLQLGLLDHEVEVRRLITPVFLEEEP
ncbi:MAG: hypothetical protein B7Z37_05840 [Verrucomicrobia bacterium 12-59-8]|nr:MAG: hypothetical protein B7Z37_05840 [Verrucomicrobia bacterium 12-59-8]